MGSRPIHSSFPGGSGSGGQKRRTISFGERSFPTPILPIPTSRFNGDLLHSGDTDGIQSGPQAPTSTGSPGGSTDGEEMSRREGAAPPPYESNGAGSPVQSRDTHVSFVGEGPGTPKLPRKQLPHPQESQMPVTSASGGGAAVSESATPSNAKGAAVVTFHLPYSVADLPPGFSKVIGAQMSSSNAQSSPPSSISSRASSSPPPPPPQLPLFNTAKISSTKSVILPGANSPAGPKVVGFRPVEEVIVHRISPVSVDTSASRNSASPVSDWMPQRPASHEIYQPFGPRISWDVNNSHLTNSMLEQKLVPTLRDVQRPVPSRIEYETTRIETARVQSVTGNHARVTVINTQPISSPVSDIEMPPNGDRSAVRQKPKPPPIAPKPVNLQKGRQPPSVSVKPSTVQSPTTLTAISDPPVIVVQGSPSGSVDESGERSQVEHKFLNGDIPYVLHMKYVSKPKGSEDHIVSPAQLQATDKPAFSTFKDPPGSRTVDIPIEDLTESSRLPTTISAAKTAAALASSSNRGRTVARGEQNSSFKDSGIIRTFRYRQKSLELVPRKRLPSPSNYSCQDHSVSPDSELDVLSYLLKRRGVTMTESASFDKGPVSKTRDDRMAVSGGMMVGSRGFRSRSAGRSQPNLPLHRDDSVDYDSADEDAGSYEITSLHDSLDALECLELGQSGSSNSLDSPIGPKSSLKGSQQGDRSLQSVAEVDSIQERNSNGNGEAQHSGAAAFNHPSLPSIDADEGELSEPPPPSYPYV